MNEGDAIEIAGLVAGRSPDGLMTEVIDNLPVAVFCKNASDNFRFVIWNKLQEQITGVPRSEALGKTDYDLFPLDAANQFRSIDQHVLETQRVMDIPEEQVDAHEHGKIWVHTVKTPFQDPGGDRFLLGISEDISERKHLNQRLTDTHAQLVETQLQLIQAEKMESVGRLAAGVAHEVKNPLALLLMGVEYLDSGIDPEDENLPVILEEMREAINRADKIIRGLVDFSSQRQLSLDNLDLRSVIGNALMLVRHEMTRNSIEVETDIPDDLPGVMIDQAKFEQVLVNLMINATHAMKDAKRPKLLIRGTQAVAEVSPDEGSRTAVHIRGGDPIVYMDLIDNGCGIEDEKLAKVFDPFFTTKPTGVGTGLGLSVVRKIIELHKGRIEICNQSEGGVRVRIWLRTAPKTDAH